LKVGAENIIFVATPAALGIWLALRFVRNLSSRVSPWWSLGGSFAGLVGGLFLLAFTAPLGDVLAAVNPLGLFGPGPFGEGTARIMVAAVVGPGLAFAFTFVNVVTRSMVNERMPGEMQGRIFAAQNVLTNLASIPPVLLTGIMADVIGVPPVFFLVALGAGVIALYSAAKNAARPGPMVY
ncbi:MAG TPA: hypothetical protein VNM91_07265, partial [Dehalococcoidia bacterium]|nr:hypothetical protein [Dehalococcoidia bacterium]